MCRQVVRCFGSFPPLGQRFAPTFHRPGLRPADLVALALAMLEMRAIEASQRLALRKLRKLRWWAHGVTGVVADAANALCFGLPRLKVYRFTRGLLGAAKRPRTAAAAPGVAEAA